MGNFLKHLSKLISETLTDIIVAAIGWSFCMAMLAGAFSIGHWSATHLGWDGNPDIYGLLSAITLIWIYEHKYFDGKYNRLREMLEK